MTAATANEHGSALAKPAGGNGDLANFTPPPGVTAMQTRGAFTTAVQVQKQRSLQEVLRRVMEEADLAGEEFYYGWGAGKDHIEGPTVKLAMTVVRCYGNCAIELLPVQETEDAWIFTAAFVDFETGYTLTRQFRQSKKWVVYGRHDEERKADIRFQIGQSKAIRNVVINAIPSSITNRAMEKAKEGVRGRLEEYIGNHGPVRVIEKMLVDFGKHGVTLAMILAKINVADQKAIEIEHLVTLKGDLYAIENGQEYADELFPEADAAKKDDRPKTGRMLDELNKDRPAFDPDKATGAPQPPEIVAEVEATESPTKEESSPDGEGPISARDCLAEMAKKFDPNAPAEFIAAAVEAVAKDHDIDLDGPADAKGVVLGGERANWKMRLNSAANKAS